MTRKRNPPNKGVATLHIVRTHGSCVRILCLIINILTCTRLVHPYNMKLCNTRIKNKMSKTSFAHKIKT